MAANLVSFILATLQTRLNDPNNARFFLPGLLNNLTIGGQKVLPLTAANWELGTIGGPSGITAARTFANDWYELAAAKKPEREQEQHVGIPCPDKPLPSLSLSSIAVGGLDNVTLQPNPTVTALPTGYQFTFQLIQGQYSNQPGVSNGPVTIAADYTISQCVCSTGGAARAACDDFLPRSTVTGTGTVRGSITNLSLQVQATLTSNSNGSVALTIDKMTAQSPVNAAIQNLVLTVNDATDAQVASLYSDLAQEALSQPDALTSVMQALLTALSAPANLDPIQTQLNALVNDSLSRVLGDVPASGLITDPMVAGTNPIDALLFQRLHTSLATPGTDYYLPGTILFFQSPTLEPYTVVSLAIPDQTFDSIVFHNITLSNLSISGTSNAVLPAGSMALSGGAVTATVSLSTLNPGPTISGSSQTATVPSPPLAISGNFAVTPGESPNPITGTVNIAISSSQVMATFGFAGDDLSSLTVTFTSLALSSNPSDVEITVDLGQGAGPFAGMVESALNTPAVIAGLIGDLNTEIASQLATISQTATTSVRTLASAQLDG